MRNRQSRAQKNHQVRAKKMIKSAVHMVTRRLVIKEAKRDHPIQIVKPTDFVGEPGDPIDPQVVLSDPTMTLYCFDRERGCALFVQCDDQMSVDSAAFYYQAQFQNAVGLVSMPLAV